jgi:hypothetical protein
LDRKYVIGCGSEKIFAALTNFSAVIVIKFGSMLEKRER